MIEIIKYNDNNNEDSSDDNSKNDNSHDGDSNDNSSVILLHWSSYHWSLMTMITNTILMMIGQ